MSPPRYPRHPGLRRWFLIGMETAVFLRRIDSYFHCQISGAGPDKSRWPVHRPARETRSLSQDGLGQERPLQLPFCVWRVVFCSEWNSFAVKTQTIDRSHSGTKQANLLSITASPPARTGLTTCLQCPPSPVYNTAHVRLADVDATNSPCTPKRPHQESAPSLTNGGFFSPNPTERHLEQPPPSFMPARSIA